MQSIARAPRGDDGPGRAGLALGDRPVSSVILGARTLEQLQENLGAADLHLSAEEAERLDAASDPAPADYPYGGPGVEQRSRSLTGRDS